MAVTHLADVPTAEPTLSDPIDGPARRPTTFGIGDKVEVRRRLDDKWARGFQILETGADGVRLRRMSDGVELPAWFAPGDVRKERKRDTWWY